MKKVLFAAAALVALPVLAPVSAQAQTLQYPGLYVGVEGGGNWLLQANTTTTTGVQTNLWPATGWVAGGVIGWDFVGPRLEVEGSFRRNLGTADFNTAAGTTTFGFAQEQIGAMVNAYYDFMAGSVIVPYIGAGIGASFINEYAGGVNANSTQFAYQGIVGVGWNISPEWRLNLDGRYNATTNPTFNGNAFGNGNYRNQNVTAMLSIHYKFGAPMMAAAAPPPAAAQPAPPSFMVFFDFDRSDLSAQAQSTIQQAANAYKTKGNARVTATGHADKSGPDAYNMALSLRRANAVKDALVRNGVPATAIAVVGRGETMPLVQTADGVREPQNRRVEIVVQ